MYCVYVIKCRDPNHYYIGYTQNYAKRIQNHMYGKGAKFTQIHGFKEVVEMRHYESEESAKRSEKELTEQYVRAYGIENIAGAGRSKVLKGGLRREGLFSDRSYNLTQIREKHPKAYVKWTPTEDAELVADFRAGLSIQQIAEIHQRRRGAIRSRLNKLGLVK